MLTLEPVRAELIEKCANAGSSQQPISIILITDTRCTRSSPTTPVRCLSFEPGLLRQPHGT